MIFLEPISLVRYFARSLEISGQLGETLVLLLLELPLEIGFVRVARHAMAAGAAGGDDGVSGRPAKGGNKGE